MKPIQPGELGILKTVFGQKPDGQYEIAAMLPIPLRPKAGEPDDLFRLQNDILVAQPAYLSTIAATLGQSIVPIVGMVAGESAIRCLGTGFFLSATGLLITAAHVLTDPIERNYGGVRKMDDQSWFLSSMNLGVMIYASPLEPAWVFRRIEWAQFLSEPAERPLPVRGYDLKLLADTAICKVEANSGEFYQPLHSIQSGIRGAGLAVGKKATAIGYGGMQDTPVELHQSGVITGDFSFDLYVSTGTVLEHLPDNMTNRQALTPGPCFRASLKLPGGMSGSPIFDDEGIYVHGVASSGMEEPDGLVSHGHGSMLGASMRVPISRLDGKTLLELLQSGGHGMVKLSIAGA
ncbi:MAG TPA: trypsin-like peptidase domain-containing protein [Allosphingosinicella sp.]|nr:trypsin-like peptidase domain-containing protein [Allosphingosinicella sp.]